MKIGNYKLTSVLGEGSYGRVYSGVHCLFPTMKVCVKQELTHEDAFINLFKEEALILERLRHG